uniref:Protein kinase domain-containing protein n=1 Tax=Macrostomum lignano TaxID=282301 RepID=A0A1I8FAF0_9PLAT
VELLVPEKKNTTILSTKTIYKFLFERLSTSIQDLSSFDELRQRIERRADSSGVRCTSPSASGTRMPPKLNERNYETAEDPGSRSCWRLAKTRSCSALPLTMLERLFEQLGAKELVMRMLTSDDPNEYLGKQIEDKAKAETARWRQIGADRRASRLLFNSSHALETSAPADRCSKMPPPPPQSLPRDSRARPTEAISGDAHRFHSCGSTRRSAPVLRQVDGVSWRQRRRRRRALPRDNLKKRSKQDKQKEEGTAATGNKQQQPQPSEQQQAAEADRNLRLVSRDQILLLCRLRRLAVTTFAAAAGSHSPVVVEAVLEEPSPAVSATDAADVPATMNGHDASAAQISTAASVVVSATFYFDCIVNNNECHNINDSCFRRCAVAASRHTAACRSEKEREINNKRRQRKSPGREGQRAGAQTGGADVAPAPDGAAVLKQRGHRRQPLRSVDYKHNIKCGEGAYKRVYRATIGSRAGPLPGGNDDQVRAPNIVRYYDLLDCYFELDENGEKGEKVKATVIVTEFMSEGTLREKMKTFYNERTREAVVDFNVFQSWMQQIFRGGCGICITTGATSAWPRRQDSDPPKTMLGTLGYMAPEIAAGAFYDEKVDIFAFGILIECQNFLDVWQRIASNTPPKVLT